MPLFCVSSRGDRSSEAGERHLKAPLFSAPDSLYTVLIKRASPDYDLIEVALVIGCRSAFTL